MIYLNNRLLPLFNISRSLTVFRKIHRTCTCKSIFHWMNKINDLNLCYKFHVNGYVNQYLFSNVGLNKFRLGECVLTNFRHFSDDDTTTKALQKALEDKEFKDILKDFANDFGVSEESDKILDDIRKDNENDSSCNEDLSSTTKENLDIYHSITKDRFKEFQDKDSSVIYSYEEELHLKPEDKVFHVDQEYQRDIKQYNVKRGKTGVYDIEELVPILKAEKCFDISVIKIPEHFHYADYMVLATAKSLRHSRAVTEFINQFYKMKKSKKDPFLKIEGEKTSNWKVMDMGNIVLHVFLEDVRDFYDLESLWLLGTEYDSGGKTEDDSVFEAMQEELEFLNCLQTENNTIPEQETK